MRTDQASREQLLQSITEHGVGPVGDLGLRERRLHCTSASTRMASSTSHHPRHTTVMAEPSGLESPNDVEPGIPGRSQDRELLRLAQPARPGQFAIDPSDDVPRLSAAEYHTAPVECELCFWHEQHALKSFCHIHNVEFGDCFTFGPSGNRPWLDYSEDTASLAARTAASQSPAVLLHVMRRQNVLAARVIESLRRALADFRESRAPPTTRRVFGPRPPAPTSPPPPSRFHPSGQGRLPMWAGRACDHCSLSDDYGSYVHIHMPERGLCWTFGERGDRVVSLPGPSHYPLANGETDEDRLRLRTWLEYTTRHAVTLFYAEQNHLAWHRRAWRRKLKQEERDGVEHPSTGESLWTEDGQWRHRCCHPDRMIDLGYRAVRNFRS